MADVKTKGSDGIWYPLPRQPRNDSVGVYSPEALKEALLKRYEAVPPEATAAAGPPPSDPAPSAQ